MTEPPIPPLLKSVLDKGLQDTSSFNSEQKECFDFLERLQNGLPIDPKVRLEVMEVLLHLERYSQYKELSKHNRYNQTILPVNNSKVFKISIPTIDEENPFVTLGDFALVRKRKQKNGPWFHLKIVEVGNIYVKARCDK